MSGWRFTEHCEPEEGWDWRYRLPPVPRYRLWAMCARSAARGIRSARTS